MKNTRMTLFSNNYSPDEYFDKEYLQELKEEHGLSDDDYSLWELMYEHLNIDLDDLFMQLKDTLLDNDIIVIADLGLWNGRRRGYRVLDRNLASITDVFSNYDYVELYVDRYDVHARLVHHDGTNYVTFREAKNDDTIENYLDKIYAGEDTPRQKTYYTRSIRKQVLEALGYI